MKPLTKQTIAVDVETTGLNPQKDRLHGVGYALGETSDYRTGGNLDLTSFKHIVGHNLRFDLKFLKYTPVEGQRLWDTRILASLINENEPLGLKFLAAKYLGQEAVDNFSELDGVVKSLRFKSVADLCRKDLEEGGYGELIARYCKEDCENTLALFNVLGQKLRAVDEAQKKAGYKKTALDYFLEEAMPLEPVLLKMEQRGIRVNTNKLTAFRRELMEQNSSYVSALEQQAGTELADLEERLFQAEVAKRKSEKGKTSVKRVKRFNWNSADNVATLVYEKLGVPQSLIKRTKTGKYDTAEKQFRTVLEANCNPKVTAFLETYLKWKKNLKLLTTYTGETKGLAAHVHEGRVYASYLQTGRGKESVKGGTVTGRLSSQAPNMQNLPRTGTVKSFFVPDSDEHCFVYFDYSQLELRLAAHLSQDEKLLAAYTRGLDLHQNTSDSLKLGDRQRGKKLNFAMIYNASEWRLASELGGEYSVEECKAFRDGFFQEYQGYAAYLEAQKALMLRTGVVVSETGRVRRLPELKNPPKEPWSPAGKAFRHALNQGFNYPIQSLGASVTKRAMIALDKAGYDVVTQVHDSVVVQVLKKDAEAAAAHVKQLAEGVYPLSLPLKADVKILNSLDESDTYQGDSSGEYQKKRSQLKIVS